MTRENCVSWCTFNFLKGNAVCLDIAAPPPPSSSDGGARCKNSDWWTEKSEGGGEFIYNALKRRMCKGLKIRWLVRKKKKRKNVLTLSVLRNVGVTPLNWLYGFGTGMFQHLQTEGDFYWCFHVNGRSLFCWDGYNQRLFLISFWMWTKWFCLLFYSYILSKHKGSRKHIHNTCTETL